MFLAHDDIEGDVAWIAISHRHDMDLLRWTVLPRLQGRGFGKRAVGLIFEFVRHPRVCAQIRADNIASRKIAERYAVEIIDGDE
jgi:RimJ/RimL family protein N-acetyltransferase